MVAVRAMLKSYWPLMLVCAFATVPVLLIAAFLSQSSWGAKHFIGINLCFPFGSAVGLLFPYGPWPFAALMWLLFFTQFPVYAAVLVEAWRRQRIVSRALLILLAHTLAVSACFAIQRRDENRWRGNGSSAQTLLLFRNAT